MHQLIKTRINPSDIYEAQSPLLWVCFCAGTLPIRLEGPPGYRSLHVSKIGYAIAAFQFLGFSVCFFLTMISIDHVLLYFFKSDLSSMGIIIQLCISYVGLIIAYITSIKYRLKFIEVLRQLDIMDQTFVKIGTTIDYVDTVFCLLRFILINGLVYSIYLLGSFVILTILSDREANGYVWVAYYIPTLLLSFYVNKFYAICLQIKNRFKYLNKAMMKLYHNEKFINSTDYNNGLLEDSRISTCNNNNNNNGANNISYKRNIATIKAISEEENVSTSASVPIKDLSNIALVKEFCIIHEMICDTCSYAEDYFSIVMLTIVTISFLIILFNCYYILLFGFYQATPITGEILGFMIFLLYQITIHLIGVLCVIEKSTSITEQNEKCSENVHKLLNRTKEIEVKDKLMEFAMQILNRRLRFTALKLFPLDRTLIFTMVGAGSTYLIILLQFTPSQGNMNTTIYNMTPISYI